MDYDLSQLESIAGGNENFIRDMLITFISNSLPLIESMEKYYNENNLTEVSREAHKLIPGVTFLGAEELGILLEDIEESSKTEENVVELGNKISKAKDIVNKLIKAFKNDYNLDD